MGFAQQLADLEDMHACHAALDGAPLDTEAVESNHVPPHDPPSVKDDE